MSSPWLRVQLLEASFGATTYATISVNTRTWLRTMSPSGPGVATNYYTDGNSAFNNYGNGFLQALQAMNVGTLRYPGGEKADSCARCLQALLTVSGWRCGHAGAPSACMVHSGL